MKHTRYLYRIVAMATRRGLRRWTDGRARQAQAASGELWAGIEGSRGGGGMAYDDGRMGARVQARLGRRASRRSKSSQNHATSDFGSSHL